MLDGMMWLNARLPKSPLQVTRQGSTVHTQYLQPAGMIGQWQMLRLAHLPMRDRDTCQIGIIGRRGEDAPQSRSGYPRRPLISSSSRATSSSWSLYLTNSAWRRFASA